MCWQCARSGLFGNFFSRIRGTLWMLWIIANEFPWRWVVDHLPSDRPVTIARLFRILRKIGSRYIALRFLIFAPLLCKSLSHSCNHTLRHSMDMRTFQDSIIAKYRVSCKYIYILYTIYNTSMQHYMRIIHLF